VSWTELPIEVTDWDSLVEIEGLFLVMITASLPQPEVAALLYWSPG